MERASRLTAFLSDGARLPFVWGYRDCSLWVADWVLAERGIDPAVSQRGSYSTALGCARMVAREGGLPALASRLLADAGLYETQASAPGDIGLVTTPHGRMMAIATGSGWAVKTADGIAVIPASPLTIWSI